MIFAGNEKVIFSLPNVQYFRKWVLPICENFSPYGGYAQYSLCPETGSVCQISRNDGFYQYNRMSSKRFYFCMIFAFINFHRADGYLCWKSTHEKNRSCDGQYNLYQALFRYYDAGYLCKFIMISIPFSDINCVNLALIISLLNVGINLSHTEGGFVLCIWVRLYSSFFDCN